MRILYLALSYLPGRKASSVHVMNMCAALADLGHEVTLVGKQGESIPTSVHDHYGVANNFRVEALPRPKRRGGSLVFAAAMGRYVWANRRQFDVVYCRDLVGARIAVALGMPTVLELHGMPLAESRWQLPAYRQIVDAPTFVGLTVISDALLADVRSAGLLPKLAPVCVAHDAATPPTVVDCMRPLHDPVKVGYVGSIYPGRGIDVIVAAAAKLANVEFAIYGGSSAEIKAWQDKGVSNNLVFHGHVAPSTLAKIYPTFDIVVMPYPRTGVLLASGRDTGRWCSPMKMFEYMASGAAIVSSDLPVLGEVLQHESNALICEAASVEAWVAAIKRLVNDTTLRQRLATQALLDLRANHTWKGRAQEILQTLGLVTGSTPKTQIG